MGSIAEQKRGTPISLQPKHTESGVQSEPLEDRAALLLTRARDISMAGLAGDSLAGITQLIAIFPQIQEVADQVAKNLSAGKSKHMFAEPAKEIVQLPTLLVRPQKREIVFAGTTISVQSAELGCVVHMGQQPGQFYATKDLHPKGNVNVVIIAMSALRAKLRKKGLNPEKFIRSERGRGYKLMATVVIDEEELLLSPEDQKRFDQFIEQHAEGGFTQADGNIFTGRSVTYSSTAHIERFFEALSRFSPEKIIDNQGKIVRPKLSEEGFRWYVEQIGMPDERHIASGKNGAAKAQAQRRQNEITERTEAFAPRGVVYEADATPFQEKSNGQPAFEPPQEVSRPAKMGGGIEASESFLGSTAESNAEIETLDLQRVWVIGVALRYLERNFRLQEISHGLGDKMGGINRLTDAVVVIIRQGEMPDFSVLKQSAAEAVYAFANSSNRRKFVEMQNLSFAREILSPMLSIHQSELVHLADEISNLEF